MFGLCARDTEQQWISALEIRRLVLSVSLSLSLCLLVQVDGTFLSWSLSLLSLVSQRALLCVCVRVIVVSVNKWVILSPTWDAEQDVFCPDAVCQWDNRLSSPVCLSFTDELKGDYETMGPDAALEPVGNGTGESCDHVDLLYWYRVH